MDSPSFTAVEGCFAVAGAEATTGRRNLQDPLAETMPVSNMVSAAPPWAVLLASSAPSGTSSPRSVATMPAGGALSFGILPPSQVQSPGGAETKPGCFGGISRAGQSIVFPPSPSTLPASPSIAFHQSPVRVDHLKATYLNTLRAARTMGSDSGSMNALADLDKCRSPPAPVDVAQLSFVQDQVATLTREFMRLREELDSLRISSSRVEANQAQYARQWSAAQEEVARETMAVVAQISEEQQSLKRGQEEMIYYEKGMRDASEQRDGIVSQQLETLRQALEQEARGRAAGCEQHEEAMLLSASFQDIKAAFEKLQHKVEGEVRQFRQSFNKGQSEDSRLSEAISAVSGESQTCYTELREDFTHSLGELKDDFTKLQETLREEQALRMATHQEMELKFRDQIETALGAQKSLMVEAQQVTQKLKSLSAHVLEQDVQLGQQLLPNNGSFVGAPGKLNSSGSSSSLTARARPVSQMRTSQIGDSPSVLRSGMMAPSLLGMPPGFVQQARQPNAIQGSAAAAYAALAGSPQPPGRLGAGAPRGIVRQQSVPGRLP